MENSFPFSFFFLAPRSTIRCHVPQATAWHNRSPELLFSSILPFFFHFSHHGPRPGSSILMPSRGRTGVRDSLSPPFFLPFFFNFFSPRSSTGFIYSHAIPRHNRSPRLPFSYILPFPFFFIFSHHGPRPGSSISMPPRGITGVHDLHFLNHCVNYNLFRPALQCTEKTASRRFK